jgi:hypothetical protein
LNCSQVKIARTAKETSADDAVAVKFKGEMALFRTKNKVIMQVNCG